jgi:hypothetical protein
MKPSEHKTVQARIVVGGPQRKQTAPGVSLNGGAGLLGIALSKEFPPQSIKLAISNPHAYC